MIKIRTGIFETNSSSTHTCIICSEDSYKKWTSGEYVYVEDISEELKKVLPDYKDKLIDEIFIPLECIKDKKLPVDDYDIIPTFEEFFKYAMGDSDDFSDNLYDTLEDISEGAWQDYMFEIELWPFNCFVKYYEDCDCGGETEETRGTITVNNQKINVVAFCATTEN